METITLYPNPVKQTLNVSGVSQRAVMEIYDMLGRKYMSTAGNSIDVSGLPKGIYLLRIKEEGNLITKKFIKD